MAPKKSSIVVAFVDKEYFSMLLNLINTVDFSAAKLRKKANSKRIHLNYTMSFGASKDTNYYNVASEERGCIV